MVEWATRSLPEGDYTYPVDTPDQNVDGVNTLYSPAPQQTQLPLPVDASALTDYNSTGFTGIDKLFGVGGQERYQTWPEKLIRSGATLAGDVVSGAVPDMTGLRREDFTDAPPPQGVVAAQPNDPMIERAQDMAGMAGGGGLVTGLPEGALGAMGGKLKLVPVEGNPFLDWNIKGFENENWFHGTTHEFNKFNLNKGNVENHLGQYPHFTSSAEDAGANYAGKGPDLTGRIERRAEEIVNESNFAEDLKYGTPEYKNAYKEATDQATAELAGPHEGAIIPAKIKLNNPVSLVDDKPTWLDFNAKYDKDGEWVKDAPLMTKLLNSFKKQGEKYNFDGQKAFDEVAEKAELYNGDIKASDLNKAMREAESLIYTDNDKGNLISSHIISNVFKDLGFDGIVMDAKSAFPNMKNIPEGTLHAVPLKKNTVVGKYSGSKLFSDTSTPGAPLAAVENAAPFYSAVEHSIRSNPQTKMSGDQWLGTISNSKGVKPEEMEWIGLKDFLAGKKNVTKQEVLDHVEGNKVGLQEVNKGTQDSPEITKLDSQIRELSNWPDDPTTAKNPKDQKALDKLNLNWNDLKNGYASPTKFSQYQLAGGENYREMLLTLPKKISPIKTRLQEIIKRQDAIQDRFNELHTQGENLGTASKERMALANEQDVLKKETYKLHKELNDASDINYKSSHWDEPNVLAHVRMNDRVIDGKKSLHLEEIQSDWHQQGRDKGYNKSKEDLTKQRENIESRFENGELTQEEFQNELRHLGGVSGKIDSGVPNAPFKKSWHELALKRMIREAAEKGYDRLSWTPGEAQAARYDLSKQVDKINLVPDPSGKFRIDAFKDNHKVIEHYAKDESEIASVVGKEAAKKLLENRNQHGAATLAGQDLKVGGEGMKGFYDSIILKAVERIGKEHGVKVKQGNLATSKPKYDMIRGENGNYNVVRNDGTVLWTYSTKSGAQSKMDALNSGVNAKSEPVHYIDIPQSLRDTAMRKGFPLFSSGLMLSPVEHDPWKESK